MIKIRLKDGSVKEIESGKSIYEVGVKTVIAKCSNEMNCKILSKVGADLDHGETRAKVFDVRCPNGGRVVLHGEVVE